jgi:hypothetical protein
MPERTIVIVDADHLARTEFMGRSLGGLTTKIHVIVDADGRAARAPTAGNE